MKDAHLNVYKAENNINMIGAYMNNAKIAEVQKASQ